MKSWKTTVLGIMACLTAIIAIVKPLVDNDAATVPDFGTNIAAFMAGIGLIFAKDGNVTNSQNPGPAQTVTK